MRKALAIACAILPLGCRQLLSSDSYHFDATETPDAGLDAAADRSTSGDATDADANACKLLVPPGPSMTDEAFGTVELVFAMRTIDLGDVPGQDGVPGFQRLGYDLDGRCTSGGDPPTCTNALREGPAADGIQGVDDSLGDMISGIMGKFGQEIITSALVNDQVNKGILPPTSILHISGYDGLQDDNHVDVEWLFPVNVSAGDAGDDGGGEAAVGIPPTWSGADTWPVQPNTFVQPKSPDGTNPGGAVLERKSVDAWVSHYRLVAKFPEGIPFRFWHFTAGLYGAVIAADIFPNTATKQFELRKGVVSGKTSMHDVFALIPIMTKQLPGGFALCTDSPLYGTIRDWMCGYPDLTSAPAGPTPPKCDMLSVAMGFETSAAIVGPTIDEAPPPKLCPPESDPGAQACDFTMSRCSGFARLGSQSRMQPRERSIEGHGMPSARKWIRDVHVPTSLRRGCLRLLPLVSR
jgi:hypothetical protein